MRASGYMITYDDANYMIEFEGFTLLGALIGGERALTSSVITAYMNANSSLYAAYASNRLVPYQLIVPAVDCTLPIISVETYTLPTIPTTPGIPTFSLTTTTEYKIEFTGSEDESGIKRYEVSKNGGAPISTGLNLFYINTDSAGITASWRVRAVDNTDVEGEWSTLGYWATKTLPPVLTFISKTSDSITFERTTVTPGVASYWVSISGGAVSGFYTVGTTPITLTGLTSGTTYTITMITKNAFGLHSAESNAITETIVTQCTLTVTVTTTDPTNQAGDDGTATVSYSGGHGSISYNINGGSFIPVGTSPFTIQNLVSSSSYTITVKDDLNCVASSTSTLGESLFTFAADFILITYAFYDGKDLDTRTRIVTPDVGQNARDTYIGWGAQPSWGFLSSTGKYIETWGGDNRGTGLESVLIDLNTFKAIYSNVEELVIDCRAFWYSEKGVKNVNISATLWKGGTPVKSGYSWLNQTASETMVIASTGIQVTLKNTQPWFSGERVATFTYNLNNNIGVLSNNDTSTPSV